MRETMRKVLALVCLVASFSVMAGDPAERKFVREGMTEGQLLVKIGKPDSESADNCPAAGRR